MLHLLLSDCFNKTIPRKNGNAVLSRAILFYHGFPLVRAVGATLRLITNYYAADFNTWIGDAWMHSIVTTWWFY
jgi:hypothetical protein